MKVEFSLEEVQAMLDAVVGPLSELKGLSRTDKAALRRWRQDGMRATADMQLLTEKANADLAQAHENREAREIVKPDWV
ncbi:MAG: hypothetical protein DWI48_00500 [Chloroflexi bacterium]|nr:MAG: hypothetical protein DWI48_00500 [Chloroflexota bacterium]